jgi:site-specific recombinase XerD
MSGFSSRTLLRGKLALESRSWTLKDGSTQSAFRIRIRQKKVKQYAYITCDSQTENAAIEEAFAKYSEFQSKILDGTDIRISRRKLSTFAEQFIEHHSQRVKNGVITPTRLVFIKYHIKLLLEFWEFHKRPDIEDTCELINTDWDKWRRPQKSKTSGRELSASTRKNELDNIRMFFLWMREKNVTETIPQKPEIKVNNRGRRFPAEYYRKVLRAATKSIRETKISRIKFIRINYYHLILVLYGTGMRVLESRNLKWNDISKDGDDTLLYIHGKSKERTIQVPPRVGFYLRRLLEYKKTQDPNYDVVNSHVFSDWQSDKPPNTYNAPVLRKWFVEAGIPNPETLQLTSFRHDFVSRSLIAGVDSLSVAKYVGSSQRMISEVYSHLLTRPLYEIIHRGTPDVALEGRQTTPKFMSKTESENS